MSDATDYLMAHAKKTIMEARALAARAAEVLAASYRERLSLAGDARRILEL